MHSDRSTHYVNHIRDECDNMQYNIVMAVMKSQRADTYGSIKKLTCADLGIPSQVWIMDLIVFTRLKWVPFSWRD